MKITILIVFLFALSFAQPSQDLRRIFNGNVSEIQFVQINNENEKVFFVITDHGNNFFVMSKEIPNIQIHDSLFVIYINYSFAGVSTSPYNLYKALK